MAQPKGKPLEDVLRNIITDLKKKDIVTEEDVAKAWKAAVGAKASAHSRPVSLRRATLGVNVDGSSWLYELTLKKKEILKKIEARLKKKRIKEIRFRIGATK